MLSNGDTGKFTSRSVWLAVIWCVVWRHRMAQVCCSVVQHETCTDYLACFGWSDTQFSVQTVPSPLDNPDASLNCASSATLCWVVGHLPLGQGINDWSHQPVTQHVATVTKKIAWQRLVVAFKVSKQRWLAQNSSIVDWSRPLDDAVDDVQITVTDNLETQHKYVSK